MTYERADARKKAPGPDRARPKTASSNSAVADRVIEMQQSAGNAAVARQLEPKNATATATMQLGAVWNEMVILPVARAYGILLQDKPDLEKALGELDFASRGITAVKSGTAPNDPNMIKIEILETRVDGLRELLKDQRGTGKPVMQLENEMTKLRLEAEKLEPAFTPSSSAAAGAQNGSAPSVSDGAAPTSAQAASTSTGWHHDVVFMIWQGAQRFGEGEILGADTYFLIAQSNLLNYVIDTPPGNPNRLALIHLYEGVVSMADLMSQKQDGPAKGNKDALSQAESAYLFAEQIGKLLTGQSIDDDDEASEAKTPTDPGEPAFTWESQEQRPFVNDTDLMKP